MISPLQQRRNGGPEVQEFEAPSSAMTVFLFFRFEVVDVDCWDRSSQEGEVSATSLFCIQGGSVCFVVDRLGKLAVAASVEDAIEVVTFTASIVLEQGRSLQTIIGRRLKSCINCFYTMVIIQSFQ